MKYRKVNSVRSPSDSVEVSMGSVDPSLLCRTRMYWPDDGWYVNDSALRSGKVRLKLLNPM